MHQIQIFFYLKEENVSCGIKTNDNILDIENEEYIEETKTYDDTETNNSNENIKSLDDFTIEKIINVEREVETNNKRTEELNNDQYKFLINENKIVNEDQNRGIPFRLN